MQKTIPLFLAMASLGLMAAQTINLSTYEEGSIYLGSSGETYTITGSSEDKHNIVVDVNVSIILDNCSLVNSYDCPILIGTYVEGVKMSFLGENTLQGSDSGACISLATGAGLAIGTGSINFVESGCGIECLDESSLTIEGTDIRSQCQLLDMYSIEEACSATIDTATITSSKFNGYLFASNNSGSLITIKNSSVCLNGASMCVNHAAIKGYDDENGWLATLPGACPSAGTYTFDIYKATDKVQTYNGPGHSSVSDNGLHFVLPVGEYNVSVGGNKWACSVGENDSNVFVGVPEPCFGLLALLAIGFLRRK